MIPVKSFFGVVGDGVNDDAAGIQQALNTAVKQDRCLYFSPGIYRLSRPIVLPPCSSRLSIRGDGANVTTLIGDGVSAFDLTFEQSGMQQPHGVTIRDIGFRALGTAGTALRISYGKPSLTSDHFRPSVSVSDVVVESGDTGHWADGIDIEGAWNVTLNNVFVSGNSCYGVWDDMSGAGVTLRGMCVNAHLTNVRTNFWAVGLKVHANGGPNTEGVFCSNCSMVAVKRGVWIQGNPEFQRISTFTWNGGLVECRVGGVVGGSAAFHLQNVWTALITGCQMISETITENLENTYGVVAQDSSGVVVSSCDINAFILGVATTGHCRAVCVHGNTFTNVANQVVFNEGTERSRSFGNVLFNGEPNEVDVSGLNEMGRATITT